MRSHLFFGLLPQDVVVSYGDPREPFAELLPEEEALISRAVPARRREFSCGRCCARRALEHFGVRDFPLLSGPRREPIWPLGVVGSVTHTTGLCVVAVGAAARYDGLGIDVEPDAALESRLHDRVSSSAERASAGFLAPSIAARVIFSAKEAVYKCQFYLTRQFLDFSDVSIDLEAMGTYRAQLHVDVPELQSKSAFVGRWARRDGYLLTASWLNASGAAEGHNPR